MISPTAYWCASAAAQESAEQRTFALGGQYAESVEAALEWLRARIAQIAEQLDPPASETVTDWLREPAQYAEGLAALRSGRSVRVDLLQDDICYTVRVRVVRGAASSAPWSTPGATLTADRRPQPWSAAGAALREARRRG
ncbi:hypothetical protein ACIQGZ_16510 [Streptomyces sp. NPDC092296]|uniref:hypothetical protein n=1 Tax=Streptomyces sp. NPDC092296 TaxID=3366012 RepID=UPI003819088A